MKNSSDKNKTDTKTEIRIDGYTKVTFRHGEEKQEAYVPQITIRREEVER